eukprot:CAMPEP_0113846540 /NCGR_PEP_ID=MMETSP0372-20130328/1362_1 /TAXON_ID=340204 /ORGANISM="Lankesteria abbotti" /LENGTH=246 /DNA_ID=CAMNT_0000815691 /DNA_START=206 /DNA_END=946 /DNA_ORIENTATION=+ /assembly_acc=CAM_ASM_000359
MVLGLVLVSFFYAFPWNSLDQIYQSLLNVQATSEQHELSPNFVTFIGQLADITRRYGSLFYAFSQVVGWGNFVVALYAYIAMSYLNERWMFFFIFFAIFNFAKDIFGVSAVVAAVTKTVPNSGGIGALFLFPFLLDVYFIWVVASLWYLVGQGMCGIHEYDVGGYGNHKKFDDEDTGVDHTGGTEMTDVHDDHNHHHTHHGDHHYNAQHPNHHHNPQQTDHYNAHPDHHYDVPPTDPFYDDPHNRR